MSAKLLQTDRCKGCGRKIVWGIKPDGKRVPLDAVAPVFLLRGLDKEQGCYPVDIAPPDTAFVSHFATCPKASEFSKNRKTEIGAAMDRARGTEDQT